MPRIKTLKKQNDTQGLGLLFFVVVVVLFCFVVVVFFLYEVKKLYWAHKTSQLHENPELT